MGLFMETTVGTEDRFSEAMKVKDPAERIPTAHPEEMKFPPNTRAFCGLFTGATAG